ncbi:MAG: glucokinase [Acidiferrobacterales bacterium]
MNILAADVGGTHTRFMLAQEHDRRFSVIYQQDYPSQQYPGLLPLVQEFLQSGDATDKPDRACFAVAGPVHNGRVKVTNLPWQLDSVSLAESLGIERISLINDFEAIGYGIAHLGDKDLEILNRGVDVEHGNRVVLGAGTGLGQCLLTWCGDSYQVHATEGGHADFAARNEQEIDLLNATLQTQSRVSYEDLLSGRGLATIYRYLSTSGEAGRSSQQDPLQAEDVAAAISEKAKQGDELAQSAMQLFMSVYGAHAGDLVLATRATGGVYLAGGITYKNLEFMKSGEFMQAFLQKPPMNALLERTPVRVILNPDVGLFGAVAFALRTGN